MTCIESLNSSNFQDIDMKIHHLYVRTYTPVVACVGRDQEVHFIAVSGSVERRRGQSVVNKSYSIHHQQHFSFQPPIHC